MADLTGLIAAHWTWHEVDEDGSDHIICACGTTYHNPQRWAEHLKFVVEQHTNGRITELGWDELVAAIPDGWELQESAQLEEVSRVRQRGLEASQATTARWRDRAERAEATIARVITALEAAEKSVPDDWGVTYIYTSQLRAALEGKS